MAGNRQLVLPAVLTALTLLVVGIFNLFPTPPGETDPFQFELPVHLREASGLASVDDETLLTHNDEEGVVYAIDLAADMQIYPVAALGEPPIEGDFEGIAIKHQQAYLVTSTGLIFGFALDPDLRFMDVEYEVIDSGLADICEIEGLALLDDKLLMPCKTPFVAAYRDKLTVFAYSLTERKTDLHFSIRHTDLDSPGKIQPTAIDFDDGHYYIITEFGLQVINRRNLGTRTYRLARALHFQPEGIAVTGSGGLVIVDDNRKGRSRLTRYRSLTELELFR